MGTTVKNGHEQNLFPWNDKAGTGLTENTGGAESTEVTETEVKIAAKKVAAECSCDIQRHFQQSMGRNFLGTVVGTEGYYLSTLTKGNKPPDEPSSYRPLCMLDIFRKLF